MRVNDDYKSWNAALQTASSDSVYSYYSTLLQLRRDHKNIIVYGGFEMLSPTDQKIFAYRRTGHHGDGISRAAAIVVAMNFTAENVEWKLEEGKFGREGMLKKPAVIVGNYGKKVIVKEGGIMEFRPFEAVVFWGDFVDIRPIGSGEDCKIC
jgi:oligo-1,6-glucosidase